MFFLPKFRKNKIGDSNNIKSKRKKIFIILAEIIAFSILAGVIGMIALIGWFSKDLPDPNKLINREIALSTKIYDRTGNNLLYEIHGEQQRTLVKLENVPKNLKNATIAAEDRQFYQHGGFSIKGIIRSIIVDITTGKKAQGGSTITQQFIKKAILTSEKTWTRKIKELVLAYQLEKKFSKDEILQMYLNEISYGSTAYGVQSAAHAYFGKDVKDLSLAQSALLAALPQSPTYYSPWGSHQDALMARQKWILDSMASEGYITKDEAEKAKTEKLEFQKPGHSIIAPHFVMYIKELLSEKFDDKTIEQGGLTVITSLDVDKQKIAEQEVAAGVAKNSKINASNGALVSLDAKTGQILAMVGSKDYFDEKVDGNVNVALRPRQPGSSFKPIVYATAWAKGYPPQTIMYDVATNFAVKGDPYIPKNYTGADFGPISMKKALAGSLNITAVKTLYLAGVNTVIDNAKKLGYSTLTDPSRYGLTLVLGGGEVTLLEHTAAYTAFARDGQAVKPVAILKIEDRNHKVLQEFKNPETKKVFEPETARQISDALSDNNLRSYVFGTKNYLTIAGRQVAVKTGTTNDFRDAWTIGYTPSYVTGVWVGNNDNSVMVKGADGSKIAAPIWNSYMKKILDKTPAETFTKPAYVYVDKPLLNGKASEEQKIKIDKISGKLATDFTPPNQVEEKTYQAVHDVLYYVSKDNPKGPWPTSPSKDPQFQNWEAAVQAWAKRNKINTEKPPTEKDDVHKESDKPTIAILSPQDNDTINTGVLNVSIQTSAPRGVKSVEYYIDNQLIETVNSSPFGLDYNLSSVESGFHTLKAISYDDLYNFQEASINLNLVIEKSSPTIRFQSPASGSQLEKKDFPLKVNLKINLPTGSSLADIKKINLFYSSGSTKQLIASEILPADENITLSQKEALSPGNYWLIAEMIDKDGNLINSRKNNIIVNQ